MPKAKLDHTFAMTATCKPGARKTDYYDDTVTGFVLECRSTGGKTYYLRYQDQAGRQQQHKIGGFGDITFAQAKKAAQRLRADVVMGGSPAATKAAIKAVPLYAELAAMHIADAELHQRSFSTTKGVNRLPKRTPYRRAKGTPLVEQRDGYERRTVRAGCGVGRA